MPEALVSIIIPLYNSEKYISETITSALNQTWPNREIIIVDDGSSDDSLTIAKTFEGQNVKVFSQENKGASAARNYGLREAKGDYIQFLDADDLLSPDKIAAQVGALKENPGKIAVCSIVKFKDGTLHTDTLPSPRDEVFTYSTDDPADFLVDLYGGYKKKGAMIGIHAWLAPRDVIKKAGPWNEDLSRDDDGEYFCRVVLSSAGIIRTNGVCYYRRFIADKSNLSARVDKSALKSMFDACLLKKEYLLEKTGAEAAKLAMFKQTLDLAINAYLIHPDLYLQINSELKTYPQYTYDPILGGKFINLVTKIFGWRAARLIQYYILYQR